MHDGFSCLINVEVVSLLTIKQLRFVDEYSVDLNATQAAHRAGYSARTINKQGPRLLKNPEIRAAIDGALMERSRRTNIKSDDVLMEIARIALHRITVGLGRRFAPSINMKAKQKALDQLLRHLGPYGDQAQKLCFDYLAAGVAKARRKERALQRPAVAAVLSSEITTKLGVRTVQGDDWTAPDWPNSVVEFVENEYDVLNDG